MTKTETPRRWRQIEEDEVNSHGLTRAMCECIAQKGWTRHYNPRAEDLLWGLWETATIDNLITVVTWPGVEALTWRGYELIAEWAKDPRNAGRPAKQFRPHQPHEVYMAVRGGRDASYEEVLPEFQGLLDRIEQAERFLRVGSLKA